MDSAEGQVQNLRYNATFPLLLNVAEQPTYFMALKDASELVKMYAMVNVNQYQIVATGATLADCEANYRQMLLKNNLISNDQSEIDIASDAGLDQTRGVIDDIRSAVIEGTSVYYLRFEGEDTFTVYVSAATVPLAPLLNVGDEIIVYWKSGTQWITAQMIDIVHSGSASLQSAPPADAAETDNAA